MRQLRKSLRPGDPDAHGQVWRKRKCLEELPLPKDQILALRGVAAYGAGKYRESMRLLRLALAKNPDNAAAWLYSGRIHLLVGTKVRPGDPEVLDKAIACFSHSLACGNSTAQVYMERACAYYGKDAVAEAKADTKTALELDVNYADAYAMLSNCEYDKGRYAEALIAMSKYCELVPEDGKSAAALRKYADWYAERTAPKVLTLTKILTLSWFVPIELPGGMWMLDFRRAAIEYGVLRNKHGEKA
jgi:tetratricopeptide (TPR) repeat protein